MGHVDTETIRVVELFAGVGGFNLGLQAASPRFETVWANQWEPGKKQQHAYECYRARFPETPAINKNLADVWTTAPEHDLLVGGFPCQDYSVAATRSKGLEGKKGVLWWEILNLIQHRKPSYLLLENVDRLLKSPSSQRGRDFAVMLHTLTDAGYFVEWKVVNAAEYGHVQRRRRVFIIAYRQGTTLYEQAVTAVEQGEGNPVRFLLSESVHAESFPHRLTPSKNPKLSDGEETIHALPGSLLETSNTFAGVFHNTGCAWKNTDTGKITVHTIKTSPSVSYTQETLESVLTPAPAGSSLYLPEEDLPKWVWMKGAKRIPRVKPNGESYIYSEGPVPFPDPTDRPSRTLLTSESSKSRTTHVVSDPETNNLRLLSPEECERLNEFPVGWTDTGMPNKARYFMMGNALVTGVVTTIGETLSRRA